eukprot:jgi/Orpsp1_1/1182552/evm.model.c7180000081738.1
MISKYQEIGALAVHIASFVGDLLTAYFNNNMNIKVLSLMDIGQHITKIIRILMYGFALEGSPAWFCYLHSFFNHFTHNCALTLSCFVIFNLYAAIVYPFFFSKYQNIIRPYVYTFTIIYNAICIVAALYEPLFIGYTVERIESSHNCSSGYRYRLYQYVLTSSTSNLPFSIFAIICTGIIVHKIRITPRSTLKHQLSKRTNISFSRWIRILLMSFIVTGFSFLNLYNDIMNGIAAENGTKYEQETLGSTYYFTASSGVLLFVLANSGRQIKSKLGLKQTSSNNEYQGSKSTSSKNSLELNTVITINEKDNINNNYNKNDSIKFNNIYNYNYNSNYGINQNNAYSNNNSNNNTKMNSGIYDNMMYYNNLINKNYVRYSDIPFQNKFSQLY